MNNQNYLSHALFFISLFFCVAKISASETTLIPLEVEARIPSQYDSEDVPEENVRSQKRVEQEKIINQAYKRGRTRGCLYGFPTGMASTLIIGALVSYVIIPKLEPSTESLKSCAIPATIDPSTDMNDKCWSYSIQTGNNPPLFSQQAYSAVNETAGNLMQKLQENSGTTSQACLSTYDCSKISNVPYPANLLTSLGVSKTSQRVQISRNNNKIPKHQIRRK